jgi:hypothetical protein
MKIKQSFLLLTIIAANLSSCGVADNKPDPASAIKPPNTDTSKAESVEKIPAATPPSVNDIPIPTAVKSPVSNTDILTNIDNYLVSTHQFDPVANGKEGINNGSLTLENKLSGISIQKAYIEASIRLADGTEFRTDYYILQNIEPGESKMVRIPTSLRGTSIVSHVVKVKSEQLTGGELKLTGKRTATN